MTNYWTVLLMAILITLTALVGVESNIRQQRQETGHCGKVVLMLGIGL